MNHWTVSNRPLFTAGTGQSLWEASSKKEFDAYCFPESPMYEFSSAEGEEGDPIYTMQYVTYLGPLVLRNNVTEVDRGYTEGYWGFPTVETSEENPSGVDLSYGGTPNFDNIIVLGTVDSQGEPAEGAIIASPYMPNLLPPVNIVGPTADNPIPVVLSSTDDNIEVSVPPGQGVGHKTNPSKTSSTIKGLISTYEEIKDAEENAPPLPSQHVTHPVPATG